jgi:hypothetical protein
MDTSGQTAAGSTSGASAHDEGIGCGGAVLGALVLTVPGLLAASGVVDQASGSEQVDLLDDALLTLVVWWVLLPGVFLLVRSGDVGRTALAVAGGAAVAGLATVGITVLGG